jgi:hypothetical protein
MALTAKMFADMAQYEYQRAMQEAYPSVIKSRTVTTIANEDGTTETRIVEEFGPVEIRRSEMYPLFLSIGEALVKAIQRYGEADSFWRIS